MSKRSACISGHGVALLLAFGLTKIAGLTGCGKPEDSPPKTYEVTGKVVYSDSKPFRGGMIEFHSAENPGLTSMGQIQDDGTFRVTTMTGKEKLSGAVEGTYTVTITPDLNQDQTQQDNFDSISLSEKYTVKPGGDNNFTITISRRQ